jgi:hypothetical protein
MGPEAIEILQQAANLENGGQGLISIAHCDAGDTLVAGGGDLMIDSVIDQRRLACYLQGLEELLQNGYIRPYHGGYQVTHAGYQAATAL